ncbi:MAG: FtsQ-type POTRA domain-containing protein [Propionibacteriales bacterium]|nr:FtsQ-type POTRA domain-containing protein [Propionibacteriales bacterium]
MSTDRFAQRRRAGNWERARRYVWAALALIVIGTLGWLIGWSNVFGVRSVDVSGESTLKPDVIRTEASVTLGQPLARVDIGAIEKRVRQLERIETVDVGRSWPTTITIDVAERTAIGWVLAGGEVKGLDRHGVLFRSYKKAPKDLVEVRINASNIREREKSMKEAAAVLQSIKGGDADLFQGLDRIEAESIDSVELNLSKGRTVNWGSAEKAEAKLRVLRPLLRIKARTYDVSAPEQPTTRQ